MLEGDRYPINVVSGMIGNVILLSYYGTNVDAPIDSFTSFLLCVEKIRRLFWPNRENFI